MNLPALLAVALFAIGALSSPLLLAWGGYCLTRADRRAEGLSILGFGALAAGVLLIAGFLTAPPDSPGIFRFQAVVTICGVFALGATGGEVIHFLASRLHARRPSTSVTCTQPSDDRPSERFLHEG